MSHSSDLTPGRLRTLPEAIGWLLLGTLSVTLFFQSVLEDRDVAGAFISAPVWQSLIYRLGGQADLSGMATVPLASLAAAGMAITTVAWFAGAAVVALVCGLGWRKALIDWGSRGWKWWCLPGVWYVGHVGAAIMEAESPAAVLIGSVELWWAVSLAGWLATFLTYWQPVNGPSSTTRVPGLAIVLTAIGVYTAVFTWMNWQLYEGLLIPHGDSAMYEEHLWNVIHGKGFRSYLDQGLFLGEHIQVIHLALLPVYSLWPSHLLLELSETLALAVTALPVYWIVRRHTASDRAAAWMAVAALLYFPLQYLDVAIDLKTFRPISFGVPLLMFAIDQMERRRWKTMTLLLLVTLTAKEDFAIVIAPLGLWLCATAWLESRTSAISTEEEDAPSSPSRSGIVVGAVMMVAATVYLLLVVKIVIPWFRGGETVHYARYFSRFGETPTEIALNMLTHPGRLLSELLTAGTLIYGLRVLIPLGGTPLLSPSRLLVGAPLFLLLCLNQLAQETPAPVHHFHAPLVPIVFWAAAAGLPNLTRLTSWLASRLRRSGDGAGLNVARFSCLCALTTGLVISIHPLSRKFWDPGDAMHHQRLYVPGERAARFAEILPLIPSSARVASTDFVHPRFTHHERSYDYSGYLRKVAGYERRVPDDTDFIVIDTRHPYSTMHVPEDVPEFHDTDRWELLTREPEPWFIVLKRRSSNMESRE